MLSLVGYLYFAANFGAEELKQVRLLVTPEGVSDEDFHAAWKERFAATRAEARAVVRAEMEKRSKRLSGGDEGRDGGADSGAE